MATTPRGPALPCVPAPVFVQGDFFTQSRRPHGAPEVKVWRRTRPRTFDEAILRFVARAGCATRFQVITRFWTYRGCCARIGFRTIKRLLDAGLLWEFAGTRRYALLSPTELGYGLLRRAPDRYAFEAPPPAEAAFQAQFAEVMLEREVQGWTYVYRSPEESFEVLRRWEWKRSQGAPGASSQRTGVLRSLRRGASLPFQVIEHNESEEVRVLLPVYRGLDHRRLLGELPDEIRLFSKLSFEIVCADPARAQRAEGHLQRWERRMAHRGYPVAVEPHRLPPYWQRAHPGATPATGIDRYAEAGLPDPRHLQRPVPRP